MRNSLKHANPVRAAAILVAGVVLSMPPAAAFAATPVISIEGRITQCGTGRPVPGLSVKLFTRSGDELGYAITGRDGDYRMVGKIRDRGTYMITVYWGDRAIKSTDIAVFSEYLSLPAICI